MTLRLADASDAPTIAAVQRQAFRISLPFLPTRYTAEEKLAFVRDKVLPSCETWVAELEGRVAGFIAFRDDWIDHLYVDPAAQGRGLGPGLLDKALANGAPRSLWTFQKNLRARRFYEARGFQLVRLTDGVANEEREPDALYRWPGFASTPPL